MKAINLHHINDLYITYARSSYIKWTQVIPNGLKWTHFSGRAPQMQSIGCGTANFHP